MFRCDGRQAIALVRTSKQHQFSAKALVERRELAGAVMLVADKQRILSHTAVGFADIAQKRQMQPDSLFWIALQSKPITAAALMMLVDEGRVNVEDPVEKYLPEFRGQMAAKANKRFGVQRWKHLVRIAAVDKSKYRCHTVRILRMKLPKHET